jgi:hypothetical protein
MDKDALGRHARRAVVQRQAELQHLHHQIEVGIGADDGGVAAAEFRGCRNQARGELGQNLFASGRGASKEYSVGTRIDGGANGLGGFREERDESGVEAGAMDILDQGACRKRTADKSKGTT